MGEKESKGHWLAGWEQTCCGPRVGLALLGGTTYLGTSPSTLSQFSFLLKLRGCRPNDFRCPAMQCSFAYVHTERCRLGTVSASLTPLIAEQSMRHPLTDPVLRRKAQLCQYTSESLAHGQARDVRPSRAPSLCCCYNSSAHGQGVTTLTGAPVHLREHGSWPGQGSKRTAATLGRAPLAGPFHRRACKADRAHRGRSVGKLQVFDVLPVQPSTTGVAS
eukprot:1141252-Pelagomonas_calceolata.AAC.3